MEQAPGSALGAAAEGPGGTTAGQARPEENGQAVLGPGSTAGPGAASWRATAAAGRWPFQLALLACYLAAGIAATWPRASYLTGRLPPGSDQGEYVWNMWWIAHQVVHLGNPWFTGTLAAPVGVQLGFDTLTPLLGLVMTPVTLLFGPSASYSLLVIVTPGLACYALVAAQPGGRHRGGRLLRSVRHVRLPGLVPPAHRRGLRVPAAGPGDGRIAAPGCFDPPRGDPRAGARCFDAGGPGAVGAGRDSRRRRADPLAGPHAGRGRLPVDGGRRGDRRRGRQPAAHHDGPGPRRRAQRAGHGPVREVCGSAAQPVRTLAEAGALRADRPREHLPAAHRDRGARAFGVLWLGCAALALGPTLYLGNRQFIPLA